MYLKAYVGIFVSLILSIIGSALAKISLIHLISNTFKSLLPFLIAVSIGIYGIIISIFILCNLQKDNDALLIAGIISGICNLITGLTIAFIAKKIGRSNSAAIFVVFFISIFSIYGFIISILMIEK